jgi:predicted alpha/beta hydrolase family esterase
VKRVIIVHGWGGYPEECWFPWLKKELEKKGFIVIIPQMPNADTPRIETWVPHLAKTVGTPDNDTFLVGHSMGCQTILRYLQGIGGKVGGAVFVGGFFQKLTNLESEEEEKIAEPWLTTPLDFPKIKNAAEKFIAIFSENDPYVPLENAKDFEKKLGAKIVFVKNKGHMGASDNCPRLPEALNAVLDLSR